MDARNFVDLANTQSKVLNVEFELTPALYEVTTTTRVSATYDGHSVYIDFTESETTPRAYRYNVIVLDAETGEQIVTGNGGATWNEALSIVRWNAVEVHFRNA